MTTRTSKDEIFVEQIESMFPSNNKHSECLLCVCHCIKYFACIISSVSYNMYASTSLAQAQPSFTLSMFLINQNAS